MLQIVDLSLRPEAGVGLDGEKEGLVPTGYPSGTGVTASLAMEPGRDCLPLFGQGDYCTSVQYTETEQVVELQSNSVHCPEEPVLGIKERVSLRSEDREMLHVTPG